MVNCEAALKIMPDNSIESKIIHAVWSSIAAIEKQILPQLNDTDLIHQIIQQAERSLTLSFEDRQSLMDYISSKIRLIRDITES